jgi:hypothetical protein
MYFEIRPIVLGINAFKVHLFLNRGQGTKEYCFELIKLIRYIIEIVLEACELLWNKEIRMHTSEEFKMQYLEHL